MQIPSGKNAVQITRKGHRYPNKRFKAWRNRAIAELLKHPDGGWILFDGPVVMVVDYVPGDRIRRDVPGLLDALCHLIEKYGLVQDDAQVKQVQWTTHAVERAQARCRVELVALPWDGVLN